MKNKAFVIIGLQNDITKHYSDIIGCVNAAVHWAKSADMHIVYIKHNNEADENMCCIRIEPTTGFFIRTAQDIRSTSSKRQSKRFR